MNAVTIQKMRWFGFCVSNAITRTIVHFFPSSGNITAPYPADCKLTVFSSARGPESVTIEGCRLSHPDGVRLVDAFPWLKDDSSHMLGLEVELSTSQPRIDLEGSATVIELASKSQSARFWPSLVTSSKSVDKPVRKFSMLGLKDSYQSSSLLLVNYSQQSFNATINNGQIAEVGPCRVLELNLEETLSYTEPRECSWGLIRSSPIAAKLEAAADGSAAFALYRDATTKRIISVISLIEENL